MEYSDRIFDRIVQNNNFRTYKSVDSTTPYSPPKADPPLAESYRLIRPHPLPRERTEVRGYICLPAVATRQRCGGFCRRLNRIMKKEIWSIAAFLFLALAAQGAEANLLANGGFEITGHLGPRWLATQIQSGGMTFDNADPLLPLRWVIRSGNAADVRLVNEAHSGKQALRVACQAATAATSDFHS